MDSSTLNCGTLTAVNLTSRGENLINLQRMKNVSISSSYVSNFDTNFVYSVSSDIYIVDSVFKSKSYKDLSFVDPVLKSDRATRGFEIF